MTEEEIISICNDMSKSKITNYDLAVQGLLDLYNKEKEKNKLLKTYKENLPENVEMICLCKDDFERNISIDYISKDKIKEKIKLINSLNEKIYYEENVISILQELLEERNQDITK